jgi:LCP family protein required for cell wall assembly
MIDKKFDLPIKIRAVKRPTTGQFIWMGVGLVIATALFFFLSDLVACWGLTALAGIQPSTCTGQTSVPVTNPDGTVVVDGATSIPTTNAPQVALPPPWDGATRVTILVIGLDYRDWIAEMDASRSDTMILLTIDPVTKTGGMLSIPRDMWVNIPGFSYNKINTAYYFGELYHLPGGGPGLAMKTAENFLGIPIQYYVQVSFNSFEQMIDTIGGIEVNVPAEIVVDPLGPGNTVILQPGWNHLTGPLALGYARNRHTENGDVDRSGRQQQVILAIRDKVLARENFLNLMAQATTLYDELSAGIDTNLPLPDAMRLAMLAKDIPLENIQRGVIDYTMMQDGFVNLNNQQLAILRPFPDKIRELVDKIFGGGTMQPMASGTIEEKMQAEAARVVVINGTGVEGMAKLTSEYLTTQGMNVSGFGNTVDYPDMYYSPFPTQTILIVHAGKPYAMQYLMALMKFSRMSQIKVDFNPDAPEDIVLALGSDWSGPP